MTDLVRTLERIREMVRASLARRTQGKCSDSRPPSETLEGPAKEQEDLFPRLEHHTPEPVLLPQPVFDDFSDLLTESAPEPPSENDLALVGHRIYGLVIFPEPTFDESPAPSSQEESVRFTNQLDPISSPDRDLALLIESDE